MSISFPAITNEWKDVLDGTFFSSIANTDRGVNPILKSTPPVLIGLHQCFGGDALE